MHGNRLTVPELQGPRGRQSKLHSQQLLMLSFRWTDRSRELTVTKLGSVPTFNKLIPSFGRRLCPPRIESILLLLTDEDVTSALLVIDLSFERIP